MKIERKVLLKKLDTIKNTALNQKGILDISNTFIFTGDFIIAYNDKTIALVVFKSEFTAIVPAKEFYKVVYNLKSDTLYIKKESEQLKIKTKKISSGIKLINADKSIVDKILDILPQKWAKLPDNFSDGLKLNMYNTSRDLSRPALTCINVENDIIQSTDNFRISKFVMDKKIKDSLMLPWDSVTELVSIKEDFCVYKKKEGWVFFSNTEESTIFAMRDIEGDFPETDNFFDVKGKKIKLPKNFADNLDLVSVLAEGDFDFDKRVKIKIENNTIYSYANQDSGWIESQLKIDTNQKISFEINPLYLKEILKHSDNFIYNDSFILFSFKNFKHIISLYGEE